MKNIRHITLPQGFQAAGVKCGIKASGKNDVALIVGDQAVSAAIATTTNQVIGAPVQWCRKILPDGFGAVRGVVINSGNSNVCTGQQGLRDAKEMAQRVAKGLSCRDSQVLVASTGIIGRHLPMEKVRKGIDLALAGLSRQNDQATLQAMMTTDLREKSAVTQFSVGGKTVTVAGVVKGSGMIAPSLATMISVVTTDAGICPEHLYSIFKPATQRTYNAVTVDNDTSTSDTAIVLASGQSGVAMDSAPAARKFAAALEEVCRELAMAIARDGEGATKLIAVEVTGAASDADAFIAAKSVANSPLFKCAVHGGDPNWGRILCALGKSAAKVVAEKTTVKIGGHTVFAKGAPKAIDLKPVEKHLKGASVLVQANLGLGKGKYTAYGCDLSREYVAINADYST